MDGAVLTHLAGLLGSITIMFLYDIRHSIE